MSKNGIEEQRIKSHIQSSTPLVHNISMRSNEKSLVEPHLLNLKI